MKKSCLYNEVVSVLTSQKKFHISLGLERVSQILDFFGNPQDNLKVIHVAGTNGKGSTCAMLASILAEAGYKTGLYTSPHLVEYTERVKINGKDITQEEFARLILSIINLCEEKNIPATEFEFLTVAVFVYLNEQKTDFVILETGLGGRLDATNIIKNPLVSIITSIDIDHTDRLGKDINAIAYEKAGIIKENSTIITLKDNNGLDVIKKISNERKSNLILSNLDHKSVHHSKQGLQVSLEENTYNLPLLGLWQAKNLSLVLETIKFLNSQGYPISPNIVKSGLEKTKWQGRFQYIEEKNLILDGAHNLSGAKSLRESLDFYFPDKKRIWIYSSLNTKDFESIINSLFNDEDIIICTKSMSKNSVDPELLKNIILKKNNTQKIYIVNNVKESLNLSYNLLKNKYILVIAGSLYTVGEVLDILSVQPGR